PERRESGSVSGRTQNPQAAFLRTFARIRQSERPDSHDIRDGGYAPITKKTYFYDRYGLPERRLPNRKALMPNIREHRRAARMLA
ncbi:hypothetical protein, partial [Alistipes ihumii]|uniref:hypothetical protein n=1 Tax=Alistipes ihumii TaxID=1470347 RepID=UPI003AF7C83B